MSSITRIKQLILDDQVIFTEKADIEMTRENITERMVKEAIINAPAISKTIRSTAPKTGKKEYLYIIIGPTYSGMILYTKGKIVIEDDRETFYVIISSKHYIG